MYNAGGTANEGATSAGLLYGAGCSGLQNFQLLRFAVSAQVFGFEETGCSIQNLT